MSVLYEVNLTVEADVAVAFREWLGAHVAQMLKFDGFMHASVFTRQAKDEGLAETTQLLLTTVYTLRDRAALEAYFKDHAAEMRADGLARFPGKFTGARRILELSQTFGV